MVIRILTVCLGNICRSPAAEAVIRSKAAQAGIGVEVDSAGTAAYHVGEPPHPDSVAVGARRGYEVGGHGRQLAPEDFDRFDLIVTMDRSNLADVRRMAPTGARAVIRPLVDGGVVPDPWGKPIAAYERMYDLIEEASDALVESLTAQVSGRRQDSAS